MSALSDREAEYLLKKSVQLRQGYEGFMLGKQMQQFGYVMKLAESGRTGQIGQPSKSTEEEGGMKLQVGDNYFGWNGGGQSNTPIPTGGNNPPAPPVVQQPQPPVIVSPVVVQQPVPPAPQPLVDQPKEPATPVTAVTTTETAIAPASRLGPLGTALLAVAGLAGLGGLGAGMYAMGKANQPTVVQQPTQPVVVQPTKPDTVIIKPSNPQGQTDWRLDVEVTKPDKK